MVFGRFSAWRGKKKQKWWLILSPFSSDRTYTTHSDTCESCDKLISQQNRHLCAPFVGQSFCRINTCKILLELYLISLGPSLRRPCSAPILEVAHRFGDDCSGNGLVFVVRCVLMSAAFQAFNYYHEGTKAMSMGGKRVWGDNRDTGWGKRKKNAAK